MTIKSQPKQDKFFVRILFCFLVPILAFMSIGFNVDAAPSNNEFEAPNSTKLHASAQMTSTMTTTIAYLPLAFGAPIAAPDLNISRPVQSGANYNASLTWTQSEEPDGATYTIIESHNPNMIPIVKKYQTNKQSAVIGHPASTNNVYYYTVELNHPNAKASDPIKVVSAYRDDFNDPSSGWDIRRQDFDETDNVMSYVDGSLKMHVRGRWDYFVTSPLAESPEPPYRISTRVKFDGPGNLNTYGIIFGGDNNGNTCPSIFPSRRSIDLSAGSQEEYDVLPIGVRAPAEAFDISNVDDNCLNYYYRMMFLWKDGFGTMLGELKEIYYHSDNNSGRGDALSGGDFLELLVSSRNANDWNEWSVEVYPDGLIIIYSGTDRVFSARSDKDFLINGNTFGFWASTDEYPGSDPLYDYILVEPLN